MTSHRPFQWPTHEILHRLNLDLDHPLRHDHASQPVPMEKAGTWLISGSAGWLGRHLLRTVLTQDLDAFILAPLQARDRDEAVARLRSVLTPTLALRKQAEDERWWLRINALPVQSLANPADQGGLPNPYQPVDHVVHCAANRSMVKDLNALWNDNVAATQNMFHWAQEHGAKRFDHVSTLAVLSSSAAAYGLFREGDDLGRARTVFGGYAASKWAAEAWLSRQQSDMGVAVHRPGLMSYSSIEGWAKGDGMASVARAWKQWGRPAWMARSPGAAVDWSPVDKVASGMFQSMEKGLTGALHWASSTPIPADVLMLLLHSQIASEGASQWPANDPLGKVARRAVGRLSDPARARLWWWHDIFQADRHRFDRAHAAQACPSWNWTSDEIKAALAQA